MFNTEILYSIFDPEYQEHLAQQAEENPQSCGTRHLTPEEDEEFRSAEGGRLIDYGKKLQKNIKEYLEARQSTQSPPYQPSRSVSDILYIPLVFHQFTCAEWYTGSASDLDNFEENGYINNCILPESFYVDCVELMNSYLEGTADLEGSGGTAATNPYHGYPSKLRFIISPKLPARFFNKFLRTNPFYFADPFSNETKDYGLNNTPANFIFDTDDGYLAQIAQSAQEAFNAASSVYHPWIETNNYRYSSDGAHCSIEECPDRFDEDGNELWGRYIIDNSRTWQYKSPLTGTIYDDFNDYAREWECTYNSTTGIGCPSWLTSSPEGLKHEDPIALNYKKASDVNAMGGFVDCGPNGAILTYRSDIYDPIALVYLHNQDYNNGFDIFNVNRLEHPMNTRSGVDNLYQEMFWYPFGVHWQYWGHSLPLFNIWCFLGAQSGTSGNEGFTFAPSTSAYNASVYMGPSGKGRGNYISKYATDPEGALRTFTSILFHELGHSLGMMHSFDPNPSEGRGGPDINKLKNQVTPRFSFPIDDVDTPYSVSDFGYKASTFNNIYQDEVTFVELFYNKIRHRLGFNADRFTKIGFLNNITIDDVQYKDIRNFSGYTTTYYNSNFEFSSTYSEEFNNTISPLDNHKTRTVLLELTSRNLPSFWAGSIDSSQIRNPGFNNYIDGKSQLVFNKVENVFNPMDLSMLELSQPQTYIDLLGAPSSFYDEETNTIHLTSNGTEIAYWMTWEYLRVPISNIDFPDTELIEDSSGNQIYLIITCVEEPKRNLQLVFAFEGAIITDGVPTGNIYNYGSISAGTGEYDSDTMSWKIPIDSSITDVFIRPQEFNVYNNNVTIISNIEVSYSYRPVNVITRMPFCELDANNNPTDVFDEFWLYNFNWLNEDYPAYPDNWSTDKVYDEFDDDGNPLCPCLYADQRYSDGTTTWVKNIRQDFVSWFNFFKDEMWPRNNDYIPDEEVGGKDQSAYQFFRFTDSRHSGTTSWTGSTIRNFLYQIYYTTNNNDIQSIKNALGTNGSWITDNGYMPMFGYYGFMKDQVMPIAFTDSWYSIDENGDPTPFDFEFINQNFLEEPIYGPTDKYFDTGNMSFRWAAHNFCNLFARYFIGSGEETIVDEFGNVVKNPNYNPYYIYFEGNDTTSQSDNYAFALALDRLDLIDSELSFNPLAGLQTPWADYNPNHFNMAMWYTDYLYKTFSFIGGEFIIASSGKNTVTPQMNIYSVESILAAEAIVESGLGYYKFTHRFLNAIDLDLNNYTYTTSSNPTAQELLLQIEQKIEDVPFDYRVRPGCTNESAVNYNPYATVSEDTCIIPYENCILDVTPIAICPPSSESYTADACNKLSEEEFNSYTWTKAIHAEQGQYVDYNGDGTLYFTEVLYGTAINGITYDEIDGCTDDEHIHKRGGFLYYYHSGQTPWWFRLHRHDFFDSSNFSHVLNIKNINNEYFIPEQFDFADTLDNDNITSNTCYIGSISIGDTSNCFLGPGVDLDNLGGDLPPGLEYTLDCPERNYLLYYQQNPAYWEDVYINNLSRSIKTTQEIHYTPGNTYYDNDGYSYTGLYTKSSDGTIFSGIGSLDGHFLYKRDTNNSMVTQAKNFNKIKKSIENICKFVKL